MNTSNGQKWVSIWGNAVSINENRPESYGKNLTFIYPVTSPFSGNSIRLTFDNYCGMENVTISKAVVWHKDKCYPLTFLGYSSCIIPARQSIITDELNLPIQTDDKLEVRFYLADYTSLRSTVYASGPLSKGTYGMGDLTEEKDISIEVSRSTNYFYFLSNISLYTQSTNRAIVCYGDSITAQAWPDYLTLRCKELKANNTSIIRRATSGSRILREYSCITYESYGLKGVNRFTHEVPTDGADTVIIQQGINDIIHPVGTDVNPFRPMSDLPTVVQLIDGLKWYIEEARKMDYKVYVGTLLPIEGWRTYAPFREELKEAYNNYIRTTNLIDGCIDFDLALRNYKNPKAFAEGMDSGDHLHPSLLGYKTMADAVPEKILF